MVYEMKVRNEEMDFEVMVEVRDYTDGTVRLNFFHEGGSHFDTMMFDKAGESVTLKEVDEKVQSKINEWFAE